MVAKLDLLPYSPFVAPYKLWLLPDVATCNLWLPLKPKANEILYRFIKAEIKIFNTNSDNEYFADNAVTICSMCTLDFLKKKKAENCNFSPANTVTFYISHASNI